MHLFWMKFPKMDEAGGGQGGGGGSGGQGGGNAADSSALVKLVEGLGNQLKEMQGELKALKAPAKKEGAEDDPNLKAIEDAKKAEAKARADQEKVVRAAKFNFRFENFLKEYAGVIPADANEIAKVVTSEKYPSEIERSSASKAALMQSFFKEEANLKFLSESQLARWKAYQSLGTVGRQEEAESVYEAVFEPAVNHARAIRQAEIRKTETSSKGSSDSDIIFRKMHEKQIRALVGAHKPNDVIYQQAKALGLVDA